jgi:mannose-6-phosphate isomerase-like protein (cupin superfamily)
MERVSIRDVEPGTTDDHRSHDRRVLTGPLDTSDLALAHYVLEPGERFSGSVHTHVDQEEVFLVVEGEATFETDDGEVTVGTDEAIRFAPGEFQSGYNDGDGRVEAFALGAPRESTDVRISHIAGYGDVACPECGHDTMQVDPTAADAELTCPECGAGMGG